MNTIQLTAPARSHLLSVIGGLVRCRWVIEAAPAKGRLIRNGQLITLQTPKQAVRIRLFVYKVTESSRGKPEERRVEITQTYQKGLKKKRGYQDVVLGLDIANNLFVGIDPRRIGYGGRTGNASSFFDKEGLEWNREDDILVRPRRAKLFADGIEYHAFLKPPCLPHYFFNATTIHSGTLHDLGAATQSTAQDVVQELAVPASKAKGNVLVIRGPEITPRARKISSRLVIEFEKIGQPSKRRRVVLTPSELLAIKQRCEENGRIGEEFVMGKERRRLRKIDRGDLASQVKWVSLESVSEGYDIRSFEDNGAERFIEVKSTEGAGNTFEMSENEWKRAEELGDQYYIYRITNVRSRPHLRIIRDPCAALLSGLLVRTTAGWLVKIIG